MDQSIAIRFENLSKKYILGKQKDGSLRGTLTNMFSKKHTLSDFFFALNNISLEIKKGDVVGIIGRNGAGKSTLLKILSEITKPTSGRVEINGRIASLLEVGTGFHPELTGRENVFLNGTILGMTRKEVQQKFDEIVAFSGVEKFIDTPVKHYSSGMYVRLAFAVAAHLEPEILIIDEVLAVGDAEFQKKCLGKMQDVAKHGRTVLFVSHHLGAVRQLCNKGALLETGKLIKSGNIEDVISEYQKMSNNTENYSNINSSKELYMEEAYVDASSKSFYHTDIIPFKFIINGKISTYNNQFLLIRIIDEMEQVIGSSEINLQENKNEYLFSLSDNILTKGKYKLNCIVYHPGVTQYDNVSECCHFEILDNNKQFMHLETFDIGRVYIPQKWI